MKTFASFLKKEFRQIFRDKQSLTVLLGMPVVMMVLFGYAIRTEVEDVDIAVLDFSRDETTRTVIQKLDASSSLSIVAIPGSYGDVETLFRQGDIKAAVVFESGFAESLVRDKITRIQIISDAVDPNLARLLQSYISGLIDDFHLHGGGQPASGIQPSVQMMYNPELLSVNLFVPGLIAVILMLVSALMTSISITREKELGNLEILLVSPLKPSHIIIGKVLPYLVLSFGNVITILILARFLFDVPFQGSLLLFFAQTTLFILTALALGVFISTVANNQQTALMVSLAGLLLPTVLLSGFIFPISSMPDILQWISHLIPAKWFLIIVRSIMLKGADISILWQETLILLGAAILFMGLSLKKFNVRLQ